MIIQDPLYRTAMAVKKLSKRTRQIQNKGFAIPGVLPLLLVISDYTITDQDYTIIANATGGVIDVSLPTAQDAFSEGAGRCFTIKRINSGANAVNIVADGSETIDGSSSYALAGQYDFVTIQSDGSDWHIIGVG